MLHANLAVFAALCAAPSHSMPSTWHSDNGDGTYSNPLFFDEFSDPDLIRVGDDYYLTGTTMHAFPGLPVLHSKDLVNWDLLSYACEKLDYGPQYSLEGGQSIYGQGFWAPCLRYRDGTFFIFSNVNGRATQLFTAKNPKGPWEHREMKNGFHDLSVLFDDDGKAFVVWGYRDLHIAELNDSLDDIVPGTEHTPFGKDALIGEGCHFYKIEGKYFITSAWYAGRMRMACARASSVYGPYEVNPTISADESFGLTSGHRLKGDPKHPFETWPLNPHGTGEGMAMHQGGIVQTQKGEWWGFSMMDANAVGRLTCLSPVTWQDGWPYFGLAGNLGRTPRTWLKPNTGHKQSPSAPYTRNDAFDGQKLANVWQWNHVSDDSKWSLSERKGYLRLHALPADDFFGARNSLTQRAIGPESIPTVELDASALKEGDVAGLALLNYPYAWVGIRRQAGRLEIAQFDQRTGESQTVPFEGLRVWLRADCDFIEESGRLSYSLDGKQFHPLGGELQLIYQLKTFQGIRYTLFCYGRGGGYADFARFTLEEPRARALTKPIPYKRKIVLSNMADHSVLIASGDTLLSVPEGDPRALSDAARFELLDRGTGRVALKAENGKLVTVTGLGEAGSVSLKQSGEHDSQSFQWTEMPRGDLLLLSCSSHRHLRSLPDGTVKADAVGAQFDRQNGASYSWKIVR